MSRRSSLPGAAELFRLTGPVRAVPDADDLADGTTGPRPARTSAEPARTRPRQSTGRQKHDEKITVYLSAEELLELEQARLTLRADHGMAVDRGRIVRTALAIVLADLDAHGDGAVLLRRLRES
jgi:hypothetical protein